MYRVINDALNRVFLGGRFESRPLYLVLDERGRADLGEILGIDPDDVEVHCCSEVGKSLSPTGDPYRNHEVDLWKWTIARRKSLPPFTALLFTLSHAAELMVSDGQFNASNYYQRLAGVTGFSAQRLSLNGKSTEQFWKALNGWLADHDFRHGRPTARAVNSNKYVGIAMSQAIVREEDRQRFHSMFEKYGFTGTDAVTEEEIGQYLGAWINTSKPTKQLKAAWEKVELRSRISEIAIDELEEWSDELADQAGTKRTSGARLSLAASFRNDILSRSIAIWIGKEAELGPVELQLPGWGTTLELGNTTFGSFATIEPRSAIDLDRTFLHGLVASGEHGNAYTWAARAVIPLSRSEKGSYWTEVNRVTMGIEHVVLVRSERRIRDAVERALEDIAAPGYTVANPSGLKGLPAGWLLYEKVVATRSLEELKGFESALSPVGQSSGLQLLGGLRMVRGIWHEWAPPTAAFDAREPGTVIAAWEGTSVEGEPLCKVTADEGLASLDLDGCIPKTGNLHVEASRDGAVLGVATILLRSASKPRLLDRQSRGIVAYANALHASADAVTSEHSIRGSIAPVPSGTSASANLAAFATMSTSPEASQERADVGQSGPAQERPALDLAEFSLDEQLRLPCAVRGFHHFIVDTVLPGYPKYAPVNMECKQCSTALLHKRTGRPAGSALPRRAPRAVPESPRVVEPTDRAHRPFDLWLDALCFLGSGTYASFEGLLANEEMDPWEPSEGFRNLSWLGHVDVSLDGRFRPKFWSVSPPALAFHAEREATLTGFRNPSLVADLEDLVTRAGGRIERESHPGQPEVVRLVGLSAEDAGRELDILADPHGRQLAVVDDAPARIAAFCNEGPALFECFGPASIGTGEDIQRFDPAAGRWRSAEDARGPGAYRVNYAGTTYAFRSASGRAFSGPHELVKLAAARASGINLHSYLPDHEIFVSRLGCEPPGLLGRALVACSGRLPKIMDGTSQFTQVPREVAAAVLAVLYSGELPS